MTETNEEQIRTADDIEADTTTPAPILEPAPAPAEKSAKKPKSKLKLVTKAAKKAAKPVAKARKAAAKVKSAAKSTKTAKKVTKAVKKAATGGAKLTKVKRPTLKTALQAFRPEMSARKPAKSTSRRSATAKSSALHVRTAASLSSDTLCGGSHSPIWNRSGEKPLQSVGPQQASKGTCGRCRRVAKARRLI